MDDRNDIQLVNNLLIRNDIPILNLDHHHVTSGNDGYYFHVYDTPYDGDTNLAREINICCIKLSHNKYFIYSRNKHDRYTIVSNKRKHIFYSIIKLNHIPIRIFYVYTPITMDGFYTIIIICENNKFYTINSSGGIIYKHYYSSIHENDYSSIIRYNYMHKHNQYHIPIIYIWIIKGVGAEI